MLRRGHSPRGIHSLITIAFLVLLGAGVPLSGAVTSNVRVLTWNVHGVPFKGAGKRLPRIGAEVVRQRPDFVLFEEVWFSNQSHTLRHQLEDAGYASCDYSHALVRRGGLLLFVDSQKGWSIERYAFVRYRSSAPWWRLTEFDGLGHKGFLTVDVTNNDGRSFTVVVTHLQSQYPEHCRTYDEIRVDQIKQLTESTRSARNVTFIGGDFNTAPREKSHGYEYLTSLWHDSTAKARQECESVPGALCGTCFDSSGTVRRDWIDYIFMRGLDAGVVDTELIHNCRADDPYSDHDGIVSTFGRMDSPGAK